MQFYLIFFNNHKKRKNEKTKSTLAASRPETQPEQKNDFKPNSNRDERESRR
jgi:hypothetical protein